jgi:uncharacterized protein (TIGR02099 family)
MNQCQAPIASATRTLKTLSALTRLLLWLVVLAWALLALTWGGLHFWIVPRIDQWRPELERWATQAVGVPVRVGTIGAEPRAGGPSWRPDFLPGLSLTLGLHDVRLLDPQGREALRLPAVRAVLSPRSLWRLGFDQLSVESPVLDVRRTARGEIEIAGLNLVGSGGGGTATADWFFDQPALVIRNATVRWIDERRGAAPLALSALDLALRNTATRHEFRLDATPSAGWGQRLSLRGQLREPLLSLNLGRGDRLPWHDWRGELYADLPQADVVRLRHHVDLSPWGVDVRSGRGSLQLWADVVGGDITGVTADLNLQGVNAQLGPQRPPLIIETLQGRVSAQWSDQGFGLSTDDLRFVTQGGQVWPGGHLSLQHSLRQGGREAATMLAADRIDLGALAALAAHLPLSTTLHDWMTRLQPGGRVLGLKAHWQGAVPGAAAYRAQGRIEDLALTGQDSGRTSRDGRYPLPGRPGIRGAAVDFDFDQAGGQARLRVRDGALDLPGVFEERLLPLQTLATDARWTVQGERIDVRLDRLSLRNADAEGTGRAYWHTGDPASSPSRSRFPGVLDLSATLTRADATRVHRYLPLSVSEPARRYVREAVRAGHADRVDLRLRGEIWDMPFDTPGTPGEFRITAGLREVDFDYVPRHLQPEGEAAWPGLRGVQGNLLLDRASLQLLAVQSGLAAAPHVRLGQAQVSIADLSQAATLVVRAQAQGPAGELLDFVRRSPLNAMTGEALAQAQMGGTAQVQFNLNLPLRTPGAARVDGTVQFGGNDLRITPESPLLGHATGTLTFSEKGFALRGAQARLYGGDLRFEGGAAPDADGVTRVRFRGQGTASAEGLRDGGLGFVSRLFARASGNAAYGAQLGFRAGEPELLVSSTLQGMAFALPAPLGKAAGESLPMRLETRVLSTTAGLGGELPLTDRLRVDLGPAQQPLLALHYERDISGPEARVLRGSIAVGLSGGEAAPLPTAGVVANVNTPHFDADGWERAFTSATGAGVRGPTEPATRASRSYLPNSLALRTDRLTLDRRQFHHLVLGASREEGGPWRATLDADELEGHVQYREPAGAQPASVQARLKRLTLPPGAAQAAEHILQQPANVPALDIVIDDLTLGQRQVGHVEIEALNRSDAAGTNEWRLTRFRLDTPEARLSATGHWAAATPGARRRTALNFSLDIHDAGQLLTRFGRAGVVRGGKGSIEGDIGWQGSPLSLDHASLSGQLKVDIGRGQFLKVEPGAAKLLGVLSLQALPRRLMLDFRDVFSDGFAFDAVRGDARIEQGVLRTDNLQMQGVNAAVLMEGSADLARETQDLHVIVVPEVNAGTASLLAAAVNPVMGLGTLLAQWLLRQPLQNANTQQFHITGSWADPQTVKVPVQPQGAAEDKPLR